LNALTALPSLREVFADVFRNLRLILVMLILPPIIAVGVALTLPPVYQADAKLLIKPGREFMPTTSLGQSEQGGPVANMAEIVKSETEILNSQDLAQDVLSKLTVPAVYPELGAEAASDGATLDRAITAFGKQLNVNPVELSNVVGVSFQSTHPDVAVKVLTALLADFQSRHVTLYGNASSGLIQTQIEAKQKALQELDAKRIQYQNANGAFSIPDQRASLIQQRAQIAALLQTAQIRGGALQQQITFLKKSRAEAPRNSAIDSETDPTLGASGTAMTTLITLRQKEQELLQHYQPGAPAVVQIRAQIAQAEQFVQQAQAGGNTKVHTGANPLLATIDQQLLSAQSELTPLASQIQGYNAQVATLDDQLRKLQGDELEVNNLQRQIDSLTADLQTLRTNLEQARFAQNMDEAKVSSVSIIDMPRLESKPVFPKKAFFGLAGLAVGLMLSALIILFSLSFGNTIITVEGAERLFGTPVVAALPRLKNLPAE
jgi:uncharacterized protein involved in exopolysaccharide biosynthesis